MKVNIFMSEVFRIIEGGLRKDSEKVKNYAVLLAEKLEQNGEISTSNRLRKLLEQDDLQLRPTLLETNNIPVDTESRFPLLQKEIVNEEVLNFVFTEDQRATVDEFLAVVGARQELESHGIPISPTLLLYGPPGCGKTHLARFVSKKLHLPLYSARLDGLVSSYLGNTSKNIRAIIDFASKTPCILFLDELDAVAKLRDDEHDLGELKRVVNSFLQSLDSMGKDTIIIAATNHEKLLDPAVWRRFLYQLYIGPPERDQRRMLWELFSKNIPWDENHLEVLADLSDGFSIAAVQATASRLRQQNFLTSLPPSLRAALSFLDTYPSLNSSPLKEITHYLKTDQLKIAELLQARNTNLYTLSVIGEILGCSASTVSRMISGKSRVVREK